MARTEKIFKEAKGRDAGKVFVITEMSARAGHAWATRALLGLMSSGIDLDDDIVSRGMAGLASVAFQAIGKLDPTVAGPLLDQLLDCVTVQMPSVTRKWIDDDFEEIETIFTLQKEAFMLHIAPFMSGGPLTSVSQVATKTAA